MKLELIKKLNEALAEDVVASEILSAARALVRKKEGTFGKYKVEKGFIHDTTDGNRPVAQLDAGQVRMFGKTTSEESSDIVKAVKGG